MLINEEGSVSLLAAFIMNRTCPVGMEILDDFPGSVRRVFTLPIPVKYNEAPAFVLMTPVSRGNNL